MFSDAITPLYIPKFFLEHFFTIVELIHSFKFTNYNGLIALSNRF